MAVEKGKKERYTNKEARMRKEEKEMERTSSSKPQRLFQLL
jgi:hypothetical protein